MSGVYPEPQVLIDISRVTKVSIHWLLTGEHQAPIDSLGFLDHQTYVTLERVASKLKTTSHELAKELIIDALTRRASEMIANLRQLDGAQVDQLYAILSLIKPAEEGEVDVRSPRIRKG